MRRPYFSIIIPTLNEEKFLPRLLNDLKKQKEKDFEIIIVDANSDDKTKEISQRYKRDLNNLKIFSVGERNVSYQRNFGAKRARGVYLIFLDADGRVSPSFMGAIKKEINKRKYLIFIPKMLPQSRNPQDKLMFNLTNLLIETSQLIGKPFCSGGFIIFQKDFFHFVGGFDENLFLAEDHEIIQRARKFGVIAKFLRSVKVKFSLRRMEKEGRLKILIKYLIALIHLLAKGKIDKKIFEYKMGGAGYQIKNKHFSMEKALKNYFKQIKKLLE